MSVCVFLKPTSKQKTNTITEKKKKRLLLLYGVKNYNCNTIPKTPLFLRVRCHLQHHQTYIMNLIMNNQYPNSSV